jgi:hypothetical protein
MFVEDIPAFVIFAASTSTSTRDGQLGHRRLRSRDAFFD